VRKDASLRGYTATQRWVRRGVMPRSCVQILQCSLVGLAVASACGGGGRNENATAAAGTGGTQSGRPANGTGGVTAPGNTGGASGAATGGAGSRAAAVGGSSAAESGGAGAGSAGMTAAAGLGGSAGSSGDSATSGAPGPSPWEGLAATPMTADAPPTRAANGGGQMPAFSEQTRAPAPAALSKINVQTITNELRSPWGVEALRDGRFVVTEKDGTMRLVNTDGNVTEVDGMPEVDNSGQGGLLDVAVDEATDPMTLCITYSKPRDGGENSTAASCTTATGTDTLTLAPLQMVFQQEPAWASAQHFGSRFIFAPDGLVYITMGERSAPQARVHAQDKTKTLGKVVRLNRDGSAPADNPFAAEGGEAPKVWSYGHRNMQAAALDAQNRLWTIEHGPRGGDELNMPQAGKNYGWPIITYGIDYSGQPIGDGITSMEGLEQPVYYWDPVIAPSGMIVYTGSLFPAWQGDIFVGGLGALALVHLHLENDKVVSEERFDIGSRVRDVTQGPDGAIYIVTEEGNGRLLRLTPE
jgi:aldose sugar dehydrogenase